MLHLRRGKLVELAREAVGPGRLWRFLQVVGSLECLHRSVRQEFQAVKEIRPATVRLAAKRSQRTSRPGERLGPENVLRRRQSS